MKTRRQFTTQLFLGTAVGLSVYGAGKKDKNPAPNFLFILTDDHGWSQLSENLDPRVKHAKSAYLETPNMDRLGRDGIRFTSAYSPAPLCTPTRRSILCGTTAARSGTEFVSKWKPADHMTMPKAIKQANAAYHCAHFGKWGEKMKSTPEECGYDMSDGETGNPTGGMEDREETVHIVEDPKRTGTLTTRAVDYMTTQSKEGNPFYLQVSYYAQHLRVESLQTTLDKYKKKGTPDRAYTEAWAAMLEELDDGVGRLLDAVDQLGIKDNTYIVFTSDNGGRHAVPGAEEGERLPPNFPLTGAKHSLYEGGIHVPLMVSGPGIKPESICHTPVAGYDLLPTFYDLAEGKTPLPEEIDGVSIRALFNDPGTGTITRKDNALLFHRPGKKLSTIRQGDYKLMLNWNENGSVESRELYKLVPEPFEEGHNIASANPEKVVQLEKILLDYLESVDAETPMPKKKKNKKKTKK